MALLILIDQFQNGHRKNQEIIYDIYLANTSLYKTVRLFTIDGYGTPAPFDPPKKFVVKGLYGHVRNPMMIGVFLVLIGETIFFRSYLIFAWSVFFMIANLIYIPFFEESELSARFGDSYLEYMKNVPRWLPSKVSWNP